MNMATAPAATAQMERPATTEGLATLTFTTDWFSHSESSKLPPPLSPEGKTALGPSAAHESHDIAEQRLCMEAAFRFIMWQLPDLPLPRSPVSCGVV